MFYKFTLKFLSFLPFLVLDLVAFVLGCLLYLIPNYYKSVTRVNLKIAFPDKSSKELKSLTFDSLRESAASLLETSKIWLKNERISLVVEGEENVRTSLKKRRGVVIFTPHLGNIEAIISYLGKSFDCFIPYTPSKKDSFEGVMLEARKGLGVTMVQANFSGIRKLYTSLKRGGVIAIASDQVPNKKNGIISKFFNHSALTMTLVSSLVKKSACPCHSVYCLKLEKGGFYRIVFSKEMDFMQGLSSKDFINLMNTELEKCIISKPEQYSWEYKRYKHSGIIDPYK